MKANKILKLHADWLYDNGYYKQAKDCRHQSVNDKRDKLGKKFKIRNSKGQFIKI